jgi:hypothetical protein
LTKQKKEPLIIDMRTATENELLTLSRLLTAINALVSTQGLSIQIRKSKAASTNLPSSRRVTLL